MLKYRRSKRNNLISGTYKCSSFEMKQIFIWFFFLICNTEFIKVLNTIVSFAQSISAHFGQIRL